MEILNKKIDELIPYEKNPRDNDKAVKYVAKSIKEFGFKVPIIVDKDTQKGIIIGRRGAMLTKIGTYAREDIEKLLNVKVTLNLFVRVEEGWRNKNKYLTEFGYGDKK